MKDKAMVLLTESSIDVWYRASALAEYLEVDVDVLIENATYTTKNFKDKHPLIGNKYAVMFVDELVDFNFFATRR